MFSVNKTRKRKIKLLSLMVVGICIATGIVLYALKQNINLFFTPTQIQAGEAPVGATIRVGGMVVENSIKKSTTDLNVAFDVSDRNESLTIHYNGILPDLFREGQGIVALGKLDKNKHFTAEQVLAKHDENYMPPEVADTLHKIHKDVPR